MGTQYNEHAAQRQALQVKYHLCSDDGAIYLAAKVINLQRLATQLLLEVVQFRANITIASPIFISTVFDFFQGCLETPRD